MHISSTDVVRAYHATSTTNLGEIEARGLRASTGNGHWLGADLVYLFDDPDLAAGWSAHWAVRKFGGRPVVLECQVDLTGCFDLTQARYKQVAADFGAEILAQMDPWNRATLTQNYGIRELDSLVLSQIVQSLTGPSGPYRSIRAICAARYGEPPSRIYPPGGPLYVIDDNKSWFDLHDHVQIGVRDLSAIHDVRRVL